MNQFVDHNLAGNSSFIAVIQVDCSEVRFIQQAGSVCGIAAPGNTALDQLQYAACSERKGTIVFGAVIHHRLNGFVCPGGFHHRLVLSAIIKLNGDAPGGYILADVVACI